MDEWNTNRRGISRRDWLRLVAGLGATTMYGTTTATSNVCHVPKPITGNSSPPLGIGRRIVVAAAVEQERAPLREVLQAFVRAEGSVVDSSPMYGRSEGVIGDLAAALGVHKQLFLATKVWTSGREAGMRQMQQSFQRLRTERMDLMQVHNLLDWRTHLATLRGWKEQGKVRYIGVTHYTASAYDDLERVLRAEDLDFVQFNYSIVEREAERRLLPLAAERRVAVLVNRPFAEAGLFSRVHGRVLPPWASECGCASWAQFFLKFIVSHPAVTCAIPATSKVKHLVDNMQAGTGVLPDAHTRERMARFMKEL